jgi:homoserine dehydrogenase
MPNARVSGPLDPLPIVLVGCGQVGSALAFRLWERPEFRLVAIVGSHRIELRPRGIPRADALPPGRTSTTGEDREGSPDEVARLLDRLPIPGILVEATPTEAVAGEPARQHLEAALDRGWHVVTSNKGPIALHGPELEARAARAGVYLRYGATVGGGVPILETLRSLRSSGRIDAIEGIVNGTSQFLLGELARGATFAAALDGARSEGLCETDPSLDLDGVDAALKAAILHWVAFGGTLRPQEIPRAGITPTVETAPGHRLVALTRVRRGCATISLESESRGGPWDLPHTTNAFRIHTAEAGEIRLSGPGAGPRATASSLLGDLLEVRDRVARPISPPRLAEEPALPWVATDPEATSGGTLAR